VGGRIEPLVETGEHLTSIQPFASGDAAGTIVFAAADRDGVSGLFTIEDGRRSPACGPDPAFVSVRGGLSWPGGVVRIATPASGALGLFVGPDPDADRLVGIGDDLDGSRVVDLAANSVSLNRHGRIAVRVALADGRELILAWDLPASASPG
jgi:hypothetical protein